MGGWQRERDAGSRTTPAGPFLIALDLLGTFIFAFSGAVAGFRGKLDLFGMMALALAGNAGGITRDPLIGAVPLSLLSETVSIRA